MCLVAIFAERESHAAFFLQEQEMTRYDAVNYISHGIAKRAGTFRNAPSTSRGADDECGDGSKLTAKQRRSANDALEAYCVNLNKKARRTAGSTR